MKQSVAAAREAEMVGGSLSSIIESETRFWLGEPSLENSPIFGAQLAGWFLPK